MTRPEVASALPRMNLTFPAFGRGDFEGNDLKFEVGGFADGIDPARSSQDDPRITAAVQGLGLDQRSEARRVRAAAATRRRRK